MKASEVTKLWNEYSVNKQHFLINEIHKNDVMFNSAQKPEHYFWVGEVTVELILSVLLQSPTTYVGEILDFGCGYGRVGRYLRAMFPWKNITFADVEDAATSFCASKFKGKALTTPKYFHELELPGKYDLIWLGSVFTHIDYERMKVLWSKMFVSLKPNGIIIGTFRGTKMYQQYKLNPEVSKRDEDLLEAYEKYGFAYRRYPGWTDDWGLSLVSSDKLVCLGADNPDARLVSYCEVGWAAAHDVLAWTNTSPRVVIR